MSAISTESPVPSPIRRVITGHTPEGKAVVVEDGKVAAREFGGGGSVSQFYDLFWSDNFPANNNEEFKDVIKDHTEEIVSQHGSVLRAVNIPPGGSSVCLSFFSRFFPHNPETYL